MELPHLDKVVLRQQSRNPAEVEAWLTRRFEHDAASRIPELELQKTEEDVRYIDIAQAAVDSYLRAYGRQKFVQLPLQNIHLLIAGGTERYTEGRLRRGAHASTLGSILVDRAPSNVEFLLALFHELFHAKSYHAVQITSKGDLTEHHSGLRLTSADGQKSWFEDMDEAVVATMTERYYRDQVLRNSKFSDQLAKEGEEPDFGRQEERSRFSTLVIEIWEANPGRFRSPQEIEDIFVRAHVTGRLMPAAGLVEKSLGKGSFRRLGAPPTE